MLEIGWEEYVWADGVCLIEWADIIEDLIDELPEERSAVWRSARIRDRVQTTAGSAFHTVISRMTVRQKTNSLHPKQSFGRRKAETP